VNFLGSELALERNFLLRYISEEKVPLKRICLGKEFSAEKMRLKILWWGEMAPLPKKFLIWAIVLPCREH
jgi:hypothetical protein